MRGQHAFDLGRTDTLARNLDDLLPSSLEIQEAFIVHASEIAGEEASADERLRGQFGIAEISLHAAKYATTYARLLAPMMAIRAGD